VMKYCIFAKVVWFERDNQKGTRGRRSTD